MWLLLTILGVFLVCIAMLWTEGFWGNVITFCNVLFAAILATGLFELVAAQLENQLPRFTYMWDFISVWLVFVIVYSLLRAATDYLSKWRAKFNKPVEMVGNMGMAVAVGLLMCCFTSFTLHMAPLPVLPFGDVDMAASAGGRPGIMWLQGMQLVSHGSLSTMRPNPFDPGSAYISNYAGRRAQLEELPGFLAEE